MFCPKCGAQIDDASRFCKNCGNPVAAGAAPPTKPLLDKADVAEVTNWLSKPVRVTRIAAGLALFSLVLLPQMSCMGQGFSGLRLLGSAGDLGARGVLLGLLLLVAFGCAIASLFLPREIFGVAGVVAQVLIMVGVSRRGGSVGFGSLVSLLGFLGIALSPRLAAFLADKARPAPAGTKGP